MKLKKVNFNKKQIRNLEEFGIELSAWDNDNVDFCYVLELNKWDVEDLKKSYSEYSSYKGDVFDTAIRTFRSCEDKHFITSYIITRYPNNYCDFLEFDEHIFKKFSGYTSVRSSTRDELKKFLNKFNYYDRMNKEESHVEEVAGCLFRVYNCW